MLQVSLSSFLKRSPFLSPICHPPAKIQKVFLPCLQVLRQPLSRRSPLMLRQAVAFSPALFFPQAGASFPSAATPP